MTTKTLGDVLASGAQRVEDAETFRTWVEGPLQLALPHGALYCGQSVSHSGGFAAIQKWSFGLPQDYLNSIECAGGNVRSPILTRLMRSGGPEFFDLKLDRQDDRDIDAVWRDNFKKAGWRNLLGLAHREGDGDALLFTSAAFYDVAGDARQQSAVQRRVMVSLHQALCRLYTSLPHCTLRTSKLLPVDLSRPEWAIVELLLEGKTNKEIGKELGKSGETVKSQLASLMQRFAAKNRTELVGLVITARANALF